MKKILITGGCGFIGTNAAVHFAKGGWDVHCLDNFSRPGSRKNAEFLKAEAPTASIVEMDIVAGKDAVGTSIREGAFDAIIHAAAQVAVTSSVADPLFDFNANALGTLIVLDAARQCAKKPVVIFTSTNKVYGDLAHMKLEEQATRYVFPEIPAGVSEETSLDFHSPYGCSKGAADQYTRDWQRIYDVPTVVFRQSCIYGAHQFGIVDQGWVAYLTMLAAFEKPITIFGDGKQVRDLLYMDDLARAMEAAIENIDVTKGQIYNIGGGPANSRSLLEFVAFLRTKLNLPVANGFGDWRPGDQKVYISDIRKAEKDFGWKPEVTFEDGFDRMHRWIVDNRAMLETYL